MSHKVGAASRVIAFEVNSLIHETRAYKAVIGCKPGIDAIRVTTVADKAEGSSEIRPLHEVFTAYGVLDR